MPLKPKPAKQADQLDLFDYVPKHDPHPIRTDGGKALAGVSSQESARTGSQGTASGNAGGGRGKVQGRNASGDTGLYQTGLHTPAGPRRGLGNHPREVHPASSRRGVAQNGRNHRIGLSDAIGTGSLKQKFKQNVSAILALRWIEQKKHPATPAEKEVLVRYVGWGGMPQVFATVPPDGWQKESKELLQVLKPEEWEAARTSTLNSHYTSPEIIRAIYAGVERLGFQGGRILEPACGVGHFIGLMPEAVHTQSSITGIELDSITARISKLLYPDADIRHSPFEKALLPDSSYDLAISNVPFGDYQPYDKRFNIHKYPIHDYFFAATMERIRPGGLIAFITSKGTLDKQSSRLRLHLSKQADLVSAIRLPNNAFKGNAHTEVTTDIVILQKRLPGQSPSGPAWLKSMAYKNSQGEEMFLNEYFVAHPQQMLGTMTLEGRMYGRQEATLTSDGRDLSKALKEAMERLPEKIYHAPQIRVAPSMEIAPIPAPDDIKPNAYALIETEMGTQIAVREGNELIPIPDLPNSVARRMRGMIRLRNSVRECLRTQVDDAPETEILQARTHLNHEYDRFYARFGAISEQTNTRAFAGDPDLPLLLSLEDFNDETHRATKTAIFRERTIRHQKAAESAQTAKEALLISLNENGKVDLPHMSWLLKKPIEKFLPELSGMIFHNPQSQRWETDDAYLSGNIREKLMEAEQAVLTDSRYAQNVEALKAVQPVELKATEIDARLGSVWIPEKDVKRFAQELLNLPSGRSVQVRHLPAMGSWAVQAEYEVKGSVANTTEWGTPRYSAIELIEDALNLRTPTVYDPHPTDRNKRIVNANATEAAREKQQQIKERFCQWIWQDDERRERLVKLYNEEFNNIRIRTFNGDHLTLPGASPAVTLRPHQKAAIWRILQTPNTLLGHVVGAGKTYAMVAAAMEAKRLGLCQKPLFAVPNHMLGQFSSELLTLYPGANILAAGKEDFEGASRAKLFSRIATGNWDAVIVTHSGFERISMSLKAQEDFFKDQINDLEDLIRRHNSDKSFTKLVKQLEVAKKRLETRLKTLAAEHKKDNTLTFEELGIDRLFIDEAHYFKNLFYVSKMTRIAGLPQTASQRAFDMYLKVQYVQQRNGGGGVIFATGTPVTNTMAEMYTMQRYLQPAELRRQGLQHFDSWAATYGEPVTAMELSPDGAGYRLNTRFARFVNVPELMQQFRQMADIQTKETLQLPTPKLFQGKPIIISTPATPELKAFVASLVKRAEKMKTTTVDPAIDNMLKITSDGRKAALDLRMIGHHGDHPQSKINLAAKNIFEIWEQTKNERLTQLVFCDLSTPKQNPKVFSAYDDLKAKLVKMGIPTEEIAFIQEYDTDTAKAMLFKRIRSGQVRVTIGSTQKMGTGTNVQERLIAEHHLDAPWRPSDIEQREGRILRQGNRNEEVKILRYVTEGSFDAYMWQILENKAKFIGQIMTNESHVRKIEDLDSTALTYAEVKAIASGNPLVIEKAQVDAEVMRLTRLRSQHSETLYVTRRSIRRAQQDLPEIEKKIANLEIDLTIRQSTKGDAFSIKIGTQTYRQRDIAGEALNRLAEKHRFDTKSIKVGSFAGFPLELWPHRVKEIVICGKNDYASSISDSPLGTVSSLEHTIRSLDDRRTGYRETLASAQRRIEGLKPHANKPFDHEEKLNNLIQRQQEIIQALDLTKNQASHSLEAEATFLVDEAICTETITIKEKIKMSIG
jgi:N12 class adenine-specific DNA methylase